MRIRDGAIVLCFYIHAHFVRYLRANPENLLQVFLLGVIPCETDFKLSAFYNHQLIIFYLLLPLSNFGFILQVMKFHLQLLAWQIWEIGTDLEILTWIKRLDLLILSSLVSSKFFYSFEKAISL